MRDGTLVAIAVYSCACGRSLQRVVAGCMLCPSKGLLPKGLLRGRLLMVDCLWPIHLCAIYRVLVGRTDNIPTQARPPSKKWPNMTTRGEWAPAQMSSCAVILEQCTQIAHLRALFQNRGAGAHLSRSPFLLIGVSGHFGTKGQYLGTCTWYLL